MLPIDVSTLLSIFYILSSGLILLVYLIPPLKSRFLEYGARESQKSGPATAEKDDREPRGRSHDNFLRILDYLASFRVPHTWFLHFYVASVASSMLWLQQILTHGALLQFIADHSQMPRSSMTLSQVALCWTLMAIQGSRRLYECLVLSRPTKSTMWIGHYAIGVTFYLATNAAIWLQGLKTIQSSPDILEGISLSSLITPKLVFVPVFLYASYFQHKTHVYLANLKKYTLPTKGAFSSLVAPHYTAECVIYLSLAALAVPSWNCIDLRAVTAWACVFVVLNLGVSAEMTRAWMTEKFDKRSVEGRWRMVPGVW